MDFGDFDSQNDSVSSAFDLSYLMKSATQNRPPLPTKRKTADSVLEDTQIETKRKAGMVF